jgi:4-carboxymuconolactone decarboxylase
MTVGTGRLTLPAEEDWTSEQRRAADLIAAGPRGSLLGPFVPLLHSPELMTRLQLVGEYLRFQKVLDDDLLEVVILTVARHWDQQFEWGFHQPLAIRVGVPQSVTDEIQMGERPSTGRDELALVWDATQALLVQGRLDDDVYQELSGMGPRAVVELIATVGYYTALALVMNVARTPAPEGTSALTVNMGAAGDDDR